MAFTAAPVGVSGALEGVFHAGEPLVGHLASRSLISSYAARASLLRQTA